MRSSSRCGAYERTNMSDHLYKCEHCGGEYTSPLAAAECEEADREDDLRNRQWMRGNN